MKYQNLIEAVTLPTLKHKTMMKRIIFSLAFLSLLSPSMAQEEGRKIPAVEIKALNGSQFNTGSLDNDGKPMIISFWATWCSPCKLELNTIA